MNDTDRKVYWRTNLRYVITLLAIWFCVSFGCGVIFVNHLDAYRLGGYPLGFFFAQQGSIYVFIILIFVYVVLMNRLDRKFRDARSASKAAEQDATSSTATETAPVESAEQ